MPFFAIPDKTSRIYLPPRGMGCFVRGDKNSMGMGCYVRGGKSLWDVLSGVAKNGMGCFVPGCFVRLPFRRATQISYQHFLRTVILWHLS